MLGIIYQNVGNVLLELIVLKEFERYPAPQTAVKWVQWHEIKGLVV